SDGSGPWAPGTFYSPPGRPLKAKKSNSRRSLGLESSPLPPRVVMAHEGRVSYQAPRPHQGLFQIFARSRPSAAKALRQKRIKRGRKTAIRTRERFWEIVRPENVISLSARRNSRAKRPTP